MPIKKQLNKVRRAALILEARAGLIPASDDIANELYAVAARIGRIVKAYAKLRKYGSDDLAITDILVDLRHYCDSRGLMFAELDAAAYDCHWEETGDLT